jgi:hypothetical protein
MAGQIDLSSGATHRIAVLLRTQYVRALLSRNCRP